MADDSDLTSLTVYLSQAYLSPLLIKETVPEVRVYSAPWPHMEALNCGKHRSRTLRKVTEIPVRALGNAVRTYFNGFEDRVKVNWENACFTMPSPGITVLGTPALSHLIVESERDYMDALQYFMLGTAAEAIRTIENRQFDDDELKFIRYLMQTVASAETICTLYTFGEPIPPTSIVRPGIVMLSLPPWTFGNGDFLQFTSRKSV